MGDNMRVGIFDSGLGGITILKKLIEEKPNNEYIFYGDTINLPYGNKSKEELLNISDKIIKFFINEKVDIILIACGTLSSTVYYDIKDKYGVKIVDIISPIVYDLKSKNFKKVGLIGTKMTILSGTFKQMIQKTGIKVIDQACPIFVDIIERRSNEDLNYYIDKYMHHMKYSNLELIIPGCTHYSIIKKEIEEYMNVPVMDILTPIINYLDLKDGNNNVKIYFSLLDEDIKDNVKNLIGKYDIEEKCISL